MEGESSLGSIWLLFAPPSRCTPANEPSSLSLAPALPACLQEHVLEVGSRRKLSVHMEGSRAAEAGAAGSAAPAAEGSGGGATADLAAADAPGEVPAGAGPEGPAVERIGDLAAWKRRQQLYGSLK